MKKLVSALGLAVTLGLATATHAADWVKTANTATGVTYDIDVGSIAVEGRLVRSWTRESLPRPQRDEKSGKLYLSDTQERFDDCAARRFTLGSWVRRDAQGIVVSSGTALNLGAQEVQPDTIAAGISRTACAVANPPKDEPIPIDEAAPWTDLGASADGKYHLQVLMDRVMKADDGMVFAVSRSIYNEPEWIDGLPIRMILTGSMIDCAGGRSGSMGADFYVAPKARVLSVRPTKAEFKLVTAGPGSFLARSLKLICAAARPEEADSEHAGGGYSVGTAWGVNKGYLVTASHVIAGGRKIYVFNNGEKIGEARVMADDPANDLAVLKFTPAKAGKITILPIAPKTASLGRSVFVLGYPEPDTLGQHVKMTAGEVSATAGYQDDARYLQISAAIQQGNSGGPVIAWDGTVVGVVEAKLTSFGGDQHKLAPELVNYALKAAYVRPMLEDLPDLANYTVIKPVPDHDQMVAEARKAVFMVVVAP